MKLPIQYACSYPERWSAPVPRLDLAQAGPLTFDRPDPGRFPCLGLAYAALDAGPSHAVVLNAANEVAVAAFLEGKIAFTAIPRAIGQTLEVHTASQVRTVEEVRELDRWARRYSQDLVGGLELKV